MLRPCNGGIRPGLLGSPGQLADVFRNALPFLFTRREVSADRGHSYCFRSSLLVYVKSVLFLQSDVNCFHWKL